MPNWAISEMSVVLPTENADKFKSLFLSLNSDEKKSKHFARCFLNNIECESNSHGLTRLYIQFNAAWSLHSCLIDGYPQESEGTCPTLEEVCKELKVKRLIAYSREPGIGFEESIHFDKRDGLTEECHDLYDEPFADYLDDNETMTDETEM